MGISAWNIRVNSNKVNFLLVTEYITTLEADVAERDRLIDAIRSELGSTKSENHALKQEIETLKKSLLQANPAPVLPPPAPLPAVSAAATVAARNSAPSPAPSSPLLAPNPNIPNCRTCSWFGDWDCPGMYGLSSFHPGGGNVAMADGSVRFLKSSTAMNVVWGLGSKAGGEILSSDQY